MAINFALTPPLPVATIVGPMGAPLPIRRVAFETTERPVTESDESKLRSGEELESVSQNPTPTSARRASSEDEDEIDAVRERDLGSRLDISI